MLEHRFNIRKEEAALDAKLRTLKETLTILEERKAEGEALVEKEGGELETIEQFLLKIESDIEVQCRIKQGQVELNNEKPVP